MKTTRTTRKTSKTKTETETTTTTTVTRSSACDSARIVMKTWTAEAEDATARAVGEPVREDVEVARIRRTRTTPMCD